MRFKVSLGFINVCYKKTKLLKMKENKYQIFNSYCLRNPLFSFSGYKKKIEKKEITNTEFKEILKSNLFREALYLASPELFAQIEKWELGLLKDAKKVERLQIAILKYYTRISTRCTPFGLFASCSSGEFSCKTAIELTDVKNFKRFTRFDTTFLNETYQELLKNKNVKEHVLFYPNTSIYKIGNHYRYVEYIIENKKRAYSIEGVNFSIYLEKILVTAIKGKTLGELAKELVDDEITLDDAISFIEALIENQILVSELEITLTGDDYFKKLINRIKQVPEASKIYKQLFNLQEQLIKLDTKTGNEKEVYKKIINDAKKIVPELNNKYLFQTDVFTKLRNNTLDKDKKIQLKKVFEIFNKMTLPSAKSNIEQFKRDFLNRFEQSEIPLNLVLDTETGIGYGGANKDVNDLLDDLPLFKPAKRYERVIWTDVDTILQEKLISAIQMKEYSIILSEKDFRELPETWNDLPDTLSSIIEIYKHNENEKVFINRIGGASATSLLGRFSSGSEKLANSITEIVATEEKIHENEIIAEIIHLPEARTGNILQRTSFRDYEIPYLGKSSVDDDHQILIEDILVSVKNDEIILRSKKLNKEILTRLGNAHNFGANPLPIYQFLCEIQTQNKRSSVGFSWNIILEKQSFLPRVEFEKFIFSKARWKIRTAKFKEICKQENLLSVIKKWQKKEMLPNFVELVEGDNRLLISFKSETSIRMLLHTIKNREQFVLEEFLFKDNEIVKNENEDSFCNQFVISFYNEEKLKSN